MKQLTQQLTIHSYQTDQYGKALPTALIALMLEAAWAHARVMEWGYDDLKNKHMFWVLSRMLIEVDRYPVWQEPIRLRTWSAGTDGMYAFREFLIENDRQDVLLRANSAWLILDSETRKIIRLMQYRDTFPRLTGQSVCRVPARVRMPVCNWTPEYREVQFSDLDINRHVHSVRYVERMLDAFGIDFFEHNEPASIEGNYLKEGQAGDLLAVKRCADDEGGYSSGVVRESDQADLCVMKSVWRPRCF